MSITFKTQSNNYKKISFKANNTLIAELPAKHPKWQEPNIAQKAMKLRYPIAIATAATGIALNTTVGLPRSEYLALASPLPAVLLVDKALRKTGKSQTTEEHESLHAFGAFAQADQMVPTGIQTQNVIGAKGYFYSYHDPSLNNPESGYSRETRLRHHISEAIMTDMPYAGSEVIRGFATPINSLPNPAIAIAPVLNSKPVSKARASWQYAGEITGEKGITPERIKTCAQIYQQVPPAPPANLCTGDWKSKINSCWQAAGVTSGTEKGISANRVKDFCEIYPKIRPTAQALLQQYDPQDIKDLTDVTKSYGNLGYGDINAYAYQNNLFHCMPELAPALTAKLERLEK